MDDTVVITLFRHGLTEGNMRKSYLGWNDSPLCEEAITQLTSYKMEEECYDSFYTSDLNRCVQTMRLLFPHVKPELVKDFREMNFGDFQGKTFEDLKDEEDYQRWVNDFHTYSPPNGESFLQFTMRVDKGWEMIVQNVLESNVHHPFVVTHGGVIGYLLSKFAPVEREFWAWEIPHGTGFELEFHRAQFRRKGRCTSLREVPSTANVNG